MITIAKTILFLLVIYLVVKVAVKLLMFFYRALVNEVENDDKEYEFPITENTVIDEDISSPCYAPQVNKIFIWGNKGKVNHSLYIHESVHSTQGVFMKVYTLFIPSVEIHGRDLGWKYKLFGILYIFLISLLHMPYVFAVELATFLETRKKCVELGIWNKNVHRANFSGLMTYLIQMILVWSIYGLVFAYIKSFF